MFPPRAFRHTWVHKGRLITFLLAVVVGTGLYSAEVMAQPKSESNADAAWKAEIENVFLPSELCKQCHDRHYEEWKGMREQTPDLKTFGRIDGALLHGTALTSPVFKTVLGLWLQTKPSAQERTRCLACHVPAVTVFPQHTDHFITQVMTTGKLTRKKKREMVEGIGCSACHLINKIKENPENIPAFHVEPGKTLFGPYDKAEDNLVHPSAKADIYRGAQFCASCHFSKVKDVTQAELPGQILKGAICQDCHMERSTGSSTSKRGSLTRPIGRHWFQGIVIPGIMLSNRNLQAEWFPRVDVEMIQKSGNIKGKVLVRNGSLPHVFPGGDPVLKQFFVTVRVKDAAGHVLGTQQERFGLDFDQLLRGPIPHPLVSGGTTRRVPFDVSIPMDGKPSYVEAILSYALIPKPSQQLMDQYLATLQNDADKQKAIDIIEDYSSQRLLTFRTKAL
ncbi:MAG: hypothetical protein VST68_05890 [Nitrospirota bacterium]|nr:hypothetical protein [Nitrospirota bacterium]